VKKDTLTILFLCTGNSCRSQMAEGLARAFRPGVIEAHSAGTAPKGLDPRTVEVMKEIGIDITGQRSKHVDEFAGMEFDYVITLCGGAAETCPLFPGKTRVIHHGFDDPPELAKDAASEDEALEHYRRVRDEIRSYVESLPDTLITDGAGLNRG
jgi:arsenate reductase (thioredoxin)